MSQAALHVVAEGGESVGGRLAGERRRSGQSLEQVAAATRIRRRQLEAIERDDFDALPGTVYARGYVRAYAEHLGLDPEALLERLKPTQRAVRRSLSLGRLAPAVASVSLTRPMLAAAGLALVAVLFALYAWREMASAVTDAPPAPAIAASVAPPPIASPQPLPSAAAVTPVPAQLAIALKATELTWISVTVDGRSAYAGFLQPGSQVSFVGRQIHVSAGKPSLEAAVGGGAYQPLGALTKEYSAET